jgi:hypothetical protein
VVRGPKLDKVQGGNELITVENGVTRASCHGEVIDTRAERPRRRARSGVEGMAGRWQTAHSHHAHHTTGTGGRVTLLATSVILSLAVSAGDIAPTIVQAPDSPVRVSRPKIFNIAAGEPAVLFYAATNMTDDDLEAFTIVAYIFDAEGTLKARQAAPGRRTLEKRSTKYSTMVLDGWPVTATDRIVFGVNQALREGSEKWWSAELEEAAKASVKGQKRP